MSWAKFDDQYPDHPKIVEVGPLGLALHTAATCYCARYLTDGFIPSAMMGRLLNFDGINVNNNGVINAVTNKQVTDELIRVGLLEVVSGGYQVHDYLEYNPPAAQVKADRDANKRRQEEYQARKKNNGVNNGVNNAAPYPSPKENKGDEESLAQKFSIMLGVSWGETADLEEAEGICLEYPESEIISAAAWLREKHPRTMRAALSALRTTLKNGTWNAPPKQKSNGHNGNGQSKSTITRNSDGTFNI